MEAVALAEQPVELRPVAPELGAFVEHLAEGVLHDADVLADADPAAQPLLQIGRGRQVVGVDVGLEYPLHLQPFGPHMGDDGIGRGGVGPPARVVEIEHAVDYCGGTPVRIAHDIGDRVRCIVEKCLYMGCHTGSSATPVVCERWMNT
jgi:hypothetical protein